MNQKKRIPVKRGRKDTCKFRGVITLYLSVIGSWICWNSIFAQTPAVTPSTTIPLKTPEPIKTQGAPTHQAIHEITLTPEVQEAMKQVLKQHPDLNLISKYATEMAHGELELHDHTGRDKLVAYARDVSHDEMARAAAVDYISAVVSEENLKLTASFLNDPSANVRCRAYYQLPHEIQVGIGSTAETYDYTTTHSEKDFNLVLAKANMLIEAYTKGMKPRLKGQADFDRTH